MGPYITWMAVRLVWVEVCMKPGATIYLHIDDTASAYIKMLLDAIFGYGAFRNEIIWKRHTGRNNARGFGRVHDTIYRYVKAGGRETWNPQYTDLDEEYIEKTYTYNDRDGRGLYCTQPLTGPGVTKDGESGLPWRGIDPKNRHWSMPTQGGVGRYIVKNGIIPGWPHALPSIHDRLDALDAAGFIYWPPEGGVPMLKFHLAASKGAARCDIIDDINRLGGDAGKDGEKNGYGTQKPLELYQLFIRASSNPGDTVLDPFVGSGTTAEAADLEGRGFVVIDNNMKARKLTEVRVQTVADTNQALFIPSGVFVDTEVPDAPEIVKLPPSKRGATKKDMHELLAMDRALGIISFCRGCGLFDWRGKGRGFSVDHLKPRVDGGADHMSNYTFMCQPCNSTKQRRTIEELWEVNVRDDNMDDWYTKEMWTCLLYTSPSPRD